VNGVEHEVTVDGSRSLLSVLRTELGMTGTKYGCGAGECGACTVMMDDQAVRSCVLPVSAAQGRSITTIEGLGAGKLHPVQEAFLEVQAFQCGYCTPGQVMNAAALLRRSPSPSESDIRTAMSGNLCRCATYQRIIRAVQLAAQKMSGVR
jgi:aerobic-type carbon monoxide dehydrogenase small subunit (CoxS/CutS family)